MNGLPPPVPTMGGLSFPVMIDGKLVPMRISEEALQHHFGARGSNDLVPAYRANAARIDAKAVERFRAAPNVPVLLKTADF